MKETLLNKTFYNNKEIEVFCKNELSVRDICITPCKYSKEEVIFFCEADGNVFYIYCKIRDRGITIVEIE